MHIQMQPANPTETLVLMEQKQEKFSLQKLN